MVSLYCWGWGAPAVEKDFRGLFSQMNCTVESVYAGKLWATNFQNYNPNQLFQEEIRHLGLSASNIS